MTGIFDLSPQTNFSRSIPGEECRGSDLDETCSRFEVLSEHNSKLGKSLSWRPVIPPYVPKFRFTASYLVWCGHTGDHRVTRWGCLYGFRTEFQSTSTQEGLWHGPAFYPSEIPSNGRVGVQRPQTIDFSYQFHGGTIPPLFSGGLDSSAGHPTA